MSSATRPRRWSWPRGSRPACRQRRPPRTLMTACRAPSICCSGCCTPAPPPGVLDRLGVTRDKVRQASARLFEPAMIAGEDGQERRVAGDGEAEQAVTGARRLAARRGQSQFRTEHLLFCIALDPGSAARRVLDDLDVDPARIRRNSRSGSPRSSAATAVSAKPEAPSGPAPSAAAKTSAPSSPALASGSAAAAPRPPARSSAPNPAACAPDDPASPERPRVS